jgi:RNA polymerase sigma factor (sigma-70 family)
MTTRSANVTQWPPELLAVYRSEYDGFVRLAYLLLGSTHLAEEVVQEAFLGAQSAWERVRTSPGGYVRSAVVNGAKGALRRQGVEERHRPDPPPPGAPEELVDLRDSLLRLPLAQRSAIALRYWADLPDDETAEILGCRPATVRSHIARGVAQMRREMNP